MSKAIAVEEAFNGVGRSRSRVIEDSTDFTQFHPLDVREENWIRATVIYRVLRTAHLFSKREGGGGGGGRISKHVFVATSPPSSPGLAGG